MKHYFRVVMEVVSIDALREKLVDLNAQAQGIQAKADQDGRELTTEELESLNAVMAEFDEVDANIARRERIEAQSDKLAQPQGRQTPPSMRATNTPGETEPVIPAQHIEMREAHERDRKRWGWGSMGELAMAVMAASRPGGTAYMDRRLAVRMEDPGTTVGSESVGQDGGFLVPPEFRTEIMQKVQGENQLLSLTDQYQSSRNNMVFPTDETTPWQTSGGLQAYWEGELDQISKSKPKIGVNSIRLHKLAALVPISDETLEDAPMMDTYLRNKTPEKINFKINLAIVQGTGAGQPLGLLNSNALVTVAKESGQTAATIVPANIAKMYARMYSGALPTSVWLINQDILPQLLTMVIEGSAGGVHPVYLPPNGLAQAPFGTIMGRPVIPTEACETLGTKGDIIFADLRQYMTAIKSGGIRVDTSMHIYFDYDAMAFRFIIRVAGQPWWSSTIARRSGSNTLSPYVTLATRA